MAGEPIITVVGNLAGDPELRFTQSGHPVANFTIAQTPRNYDQQSGQWVDDEVMWVRCSVWRQYAENVAESLTKGMHVVATGKLKARSFEDQQGNQRTNWELTVDEIGPSLRWVTAQTQQANSNGGGAPQGGWNQGGNPQGNPQGGQGYPQGGQGYPQPQPGGPPQGGQGYPPQGGQNGPPQGNPQGGQQGGFWQGGGHELDQAQNGPPPF